MIACTCRKAVHEESPGSAGQGCRVTPGQGDLKESATEIDRLMENAVVFFEGKGGKAR